MTSDELAWNLYMELRKELVSTQQLRARAIEFKITFVGTSMALIVANLSAIDSRLLILPAYAAVFFDLLVISYSLAIKRKGAYVRLNLEPQLKEASAWPNQYQFWEEFMQRSAPRQWLSFIANVGFTALAAVPGILVLLVKSSVATADIMLIIGAVGGLICVAIAHGGMAYYINLKENDKKLQPVP